MTTLQHPDTTPAAAGVSSGSSERDPSSMVEHSTISPTTQSPIASLLHHLRQRGIVEIHVREPSGGTIVLTAAGCVARIQAFHASLIRTADAHAASMLDIGWLLLQVRTNFPRGAWLPWLRSIGLHGKRAQEWMRIAGEFANPDGSPDLAKASEVGVLGENGRMLVNATKLRSIVREMRMERRTKAGEKMPGKADDLDDVLGLRLGEDDELDDDQGDDDEPLEIDMATRAARIAALKASIAGTPRTDNETDMLPDPVGLNRNTTHVARVGEVPSAGDSGTHAPVQNPGVASDVGGSFRTSGPGEAETPMVQTTSVRGASGEQFTFEQHRERLRHEVRQLVSQIEDLLACAERGEVSMESAYAQICILRGEAVRVRRDAA